MQNELEAPDLVKKAVPTLAAVPKSGAITRIGRQAYTVMILLASEQAAANPELQTFKAPLSSVLRGFDGAEGTASALKHHLKSMVTHVIDWQSPSDGEGEGTTWTASALVAEVSIFKKNGDNWLEWAYAPKMRSEILAPTLYAQIRRSTVARFRTHAALALYEICARYKDNPRHLTAKQPWQWWVPVLTGKPAPKVMKTEFRFFNRDTLKPALDEVNEVSELQVEVLEIRNGRSIEYLQFRVASKPDSYEQKPSPVDLALLTKANSHGVQSDVAEDLYFRHGELKFANALEKLAKRMAMSEYPSVASPQAYLKAILAGREKEDLNPIQVSHPTIENKSRLPKNEDVAPSPAKEAIERINQLQAERTFNANAEIAAMSDRDRQDLLNALKENAPLTEAAIKRINDGKWDSPIVKGDVLRFYWKKTRGFELTDL